MLLIIRSKQNESNYLAWFLCKILTKYFLIIYIYIFIILIIIKQLQMTLFVPIKNNQSLMIPSQVQMIISTLQLINPNHAHYFKSIVEKHLSRIVQLTSTIKIERVIQRKRAVQQSILKDNVSQDNNSFLYFYLLVSNFLQYSIGMAYAIKWFQIAYNYSKNSNELGMKIIEYYLLLNELKALQYTVQLQFRSSNQKELKKIKQFIKKHFLKDSYKIRQIIKKGVLQKDQNQLQKQKLGIYLIQRYNALLKTLITIDKRDYQQYLDLVWNLMLLNKFQAATSWCQELRQLNPPSADIQFQLATNYGLLNEYNSAVECCKQALRIDPTYQPTYLTIVIGLTALKQFRQAKQYAQRFLKLNPNNSQAYFLFGQIFFQQKDYYTAKRYLLKSISKNRNNYTAHMLLGDIYFQVNQIEEAIKSYKTSIKIRPLPQACNKLAFCYLFKSDWLNAFACFKSAIQTDYQKDISYYNLAILYNECNNESLKRSINQFMQNFRYLHNNSLIVEYNSNMFYKQSKHPKFSLQLQQMVSRMIPTEQEKQQPSIYGELINNITHNYINLTQQSSRNYNVQYVILMAIFWQIKKKPLKSNQIYDKLMRPYRQKANQNIKQTFFSFFKQHISKQSTIMQSLSLQFILKRIIKENPAQTIECFMKILNFTPFSYEVFSYQLRQNYHQEISIIDQMFRLFQDILKEQSEQDWIQPEDNQNLLSAVKKSKFDKSTLIEFLNNTTSMYSLTSLWSNTAKNAYEQDVTILRQINRLFFKYFNYQIQDQESQQLTQGRKIIKFNQDLRRPLLKCIEWNEEIQKGGEFCELINLIKAQEKQYQNGILNYVRLYPTEEDMVPLFVGLSSHISEYFQDKYLINQLCKLILNQLSPYMFHFNYKGTVKPLCDFIINCKKNKSFTSVEPALSDLFNVSQPQQSFQVVNPKINGRYQTIEQSDQQWSADNEEYTFKYYWDIFFQSDSLSLQSQQNAVLSIQDLGQFKQEQLNISSISEGYQDKKQQHKQEHLKERQKQLPEERIQQTEQNQRYYIRDEDSEDDEIYQQLEVIEQVQQQQHEDEDETIQASFIKNYKEKQVNNQNSSQSSQESNNQWNFQIENSEQSSQQYNSQQSHLSAYSSLINHDFQEQNPVVKYLSTITKNHNLPCGYTANKSMRQSIFQNTNNIIFYLAANRNKFNHIAKHYIRHETILRTRKDRQFLFLVQKGDSNFSNYRAQDSYGHYLWEIGFKYVVEWIISIAKGISQLEKCGIFHYDLLFRNTIRIGQSFKIIDFDRAFVVKRCSQFQGNVKAYKSTKKIIKNWLRSHNQQRYNQRSFILYMFDGPQDNQLITKILTLKQYISFDNLSGIANQIMKLLQKFMCKSHLDQFINSVKYRLLDNRLVQKFKYKIGNLQNIIYINKMIDCMSSGAIGYPNFISQMQAIKKNFKQIT